MTALEETHDSTREERCIRAMTWLLARFPVLGSRARIASEYTLDAVETLALENPGCTVTATMVRSTLGLPEEAEPTISIVLAALLATGGIPELVIVS